MIRFTTMLIIIPACALSWTADLLAEERPNVSQDRRLEQPYAERIQLRASRDPKTGDFRFAQNEFAIIDLIYVNGGKFQMGSGSDNPNSIPAHEVELSAFWMSKCEITQDLFDDWYYAFHPTSGESPAPETTKSPLKDLPTPQSAHTFSDYRHFDDYDSHRPLTGLTQYAAQHFCQWLTARTGRYYRLPTEAEWEYAARAGTNTAWSFGNDPARLNDYAWFGEELSGGAHVVGKKQPNPWGFYDMSGNAAEWVLDGWSNQKADFSAIISTDPWIRRKKDGGFGVVRGGDWTSHPDDLRTTARRKQDDWTGRTWHHDWRWYDLGSDGRRVGFRVVSPVKPEKDSRGTYLTIPSGND